MFPFVAPMLTVFKLARTCPKCGAKQIVSRDQKFESVTCRTCGQPIPPKKA